MLANKKAQIEQWFVLYASLLSTESIDAVWNIHNYITGNY